jgi:hypothetical protein
MLIKFKSKTQVEAGRSYWPVDFLGLSKWVVDDIHVQLNYAINIIPVVHHFILVSAEPNHHPHWQFFKRTHRSYARKRCKEKETGMVWTFEVENQKRFQRREMTGSDLANGQSWQDHIVTSHVAIRSFSIGHDDDRCFFACSIASI